MRHLLNTLFVMNEEAYLSLENNNIEVSQNNVVLRKFPLHLFEQIIYFGYRGASPALLGKCAENGIGFSFMKPSGRFLARVNGNNYGNVLLRKHQYRMSDDVEQSCFVARNFIVGKLYNSRSILERACRDHGLRLPVEHIKSCSNDILTLARRAKHCEDLDILRGLEGDAASIYFSCFNDLILQEKNYFTFSGRVKRPPTDAVNALLSFTYTLLANDCASALESVGLDSYVGFLHRDRPGRTSLALDLMEEFRSIVADRFVLTTINNRIVTKKSFLKQENGSVILTDDARKKFLGEWQERKKTVITHPFLNEKIPWGLVPYVQALLLTRHLRGDLDEYPCFMWK